jgi:hypothetical protein
MITSITTQGGAGCMFRCSGWQDFWTERGIHGQKLRPDTPEPLDSRGRLSLHELLLTEFVSGLLQLVERLV